ncbi:BTB/POZ domain-containing protein At2g04740 [Selaginella moellendorffii]|uniref:BTB/POZ domain-containing protein At2g04740 n=1 Tax=Selaginella moellendorffii TaxID=88036 RepID=UPI000D1C431E|nr:BTB/POZ domain-containing protein At2g04740 [Selaginella moellendorffii]XP_024525734.1 BTB/POZ domain-containing protein At2g04740 [Selaginella moellendorffii]XP_024525735.1 BTB/POZ domain-containing protein At2g04740 [Selaginella moellendorffii]XP_024525736.1 BTB/POZ domain-containing protein At2g04740 [Selaginella moellendorffii]XP_024525737.1 BTB/POZ domain-containing protein At2g04740 [Selaginella moellendorffii]XP_024525738.1 BTB/POZ domain-containing protein At2g04740 [Selaginella moe|eukprot:XP_024525733.1 BTB/POZ domain-containing protein At2g04740 [Selaginella moellendorffii]
MVAAAEDDLDKQHADEGYDELDSYIRRKKKVPCGDVYEAARAGDIDRLKILLESGINVNARDEWDSVALYYACLAGHEDAARILLEGGAICSEHTFDGDRCHYAALNLRVRRLLKLFEARPPPLAPLPDSLRALFFRSGQNHRFLDPTLGDTGNFDADELGDPVGPDIVFYAQGQPIAAHRAILSARCRFFQRKFEKEWKSRSEIRFSRNRLSFHALFRLISFFYCDVLDVAVDDMEDLLRICKVCGCSGLQRVLEKELVHQKFADYKSLNTDDDSLKRFIMQGSSLPDEERLTWAMDRLFSLLKHKSFGEEKVDGGQDFADICFLVEDTSFRCHRAIVAARSDYLRTRILRMGEFSGAVCVPEADGLEILEERDLSADVFGKVLRYIYTDVLEEFELEQAEELLDVASRYLLFPLRRAVADAVYPHLENASPAELCKWLLVADMYGVTRIREFCLDTIAVNFESFAATSEFKALLQRLPPPSGDTSTRTTIPNAPGGVKDDSQGNLLDDLRERWLEAEGAELDQRDESARDFDKVLELLRSTAENDDTESLELV